MMIALLACIVLAALGLGSTIGFQRGRKAGYISGLRRATTMLESFVEPSQEQAQ